MYKKIKLLREHFGLSESQISSLLNISSYKYKRFENGTLEIPIIIIVLLAIMYDLSIDELVFDRYSLSDILDSKSTEHFLRCSSEENFLRLEKNICEYCSAENCVLNYRTIKNVQNALNEKFSKNLFNIRTIKKLEILEISRLLNVSVEYYTNIEQGKFWPKIHEVIKLSQILLISIDEMFK